MYISMAPATAAGATVLGVGLLNVDSSGDTPSSLAATGSHSVTLTIVAVLLLALGLVLVAWSAKHPRR